MSLVTALLAWVLAAAPAPAPVEFEKCTTPRLPDPDSVQTVQLVRRDRERRDTYTSANLYGQRNAAGELRLLVRITRPEEMRGTFLSISERREQIEIFFGSPELPGPKRITGAEALGALFNSDFTVEDFANLQGFARPKSKQRKTDSEIAGRKVYVVELRPEEGSSGYERIVSSFDQEKCVPLRSEMYERGGRLRKVQTIAPEAVIWSSLAGAWLPQRVLLEDLRDGTKSWLDLVSADFEVPIAETVFGRPAGRSR
jgi:hypothetical protein